MIVIKGKIKYRAWTCLNCKHKKNIDADKCAICHFKKPVEKILIHYGGCNFLCRAHTSLNSPTVALMRTFPSSEAFLTIPLIISSPSVRECILDAFEFSEEVRQLCVSGAAEIGNKNAMEEALKVGHAPVLEIPLSDIVNKDTDTVNRDTFTSATSELHAVANSSHHGALGDAPPSLYDQVVENASRLIYDLGTGRYVLKPNLPAGMTPQEKKIAQTALASSLPANLVNVADSAHSYADKMKKSKQSLQKAMVIALKSEGNLDSVHSAPNKEGKYKDLISPMKKIPCGLCGITFPESALMGKVTLKAIVNWREAHGTPDGLTHAQKTASAIYSPAKVCLFCFQFFDAGNFGKVFEESYRLRDEIFGINNENMEDVKKKSLSVNSKKPPRAPSDTKKSSPKSKRSSKISLSPITVPETNQAETALSLVKRLKRQGGTSRRSTSSDSFMRKKPSNANAGPRPMSALDAEIAKISLRTRHTMSGLANSGVNSNTVPSMLRDKYKTIKSVYQELMEGDKQTSRINQKMKRRKMRYEQALKKHKLEDADLVEHKSHKHPEKMPQSTRRRNARNLSFREVSQLGVSFNSNPKPMGIPRRSSVMGVDGSCGDDEMDEIDEEVSELADRLLNPMEEDLGAFFDDRSMPVSYGQLKDRTQVKLIRTLNGNRGGRENPYYDSKQNGGGGPKKHMKQLGHSKSAQEEKEADFKKVLNHALRKKSVIGEMIRSKIDKTNMKREMWKKKNQEKMEAMKKNIGSVSGASNGNRLRGKNGKLGGRARGNRSLSKNKRKPPPRRHINSRASNPKSDKDSSQSSRVLKPIKESTREREAALKHKARNQKSLAERKRMGGTMKPPVKAAVTEPKLGTVPAPRRPARQPLVMLVPNKAEDGKEGQFQSSVKRIEATLPPISQRHGENGMNTNSNTIGNSNGHTGYVPIIIKRKGVVTNECVGNNTKARENDLAVPESVLNKSSSFSDRPANNAKVPKKNLTVETTRKSMDLEEASSDCYEPVESLGVEDGNDENSYYSDSFEEETPLSIDITVNSNSNLDSNPNKMNHMQFVAPNITSNAADDVKISDDIEEELAPLETEFLEPRGSANSKENTPASVNKYAISVKKKLKSGGFLSLPSSPGPVIEEGMEVDEAAWQQYWGGAEPIEFGDSNADGGRIRHADFDSPGPSPGPSRCESRGYSRGKQSRQGERSTTAASVVAFEDLRAGALDPVVTNSAPTNSSKCFSTPSSRQGGRTRVDNTSHVGMIRALSRGGTANGMREKGASRGSIGTPGECIRLLSARNDTLRTPSNRDLHSSGGVSRRTYSREGSNINVMVALNG